MKFLGVFDPVLQERLGLIENHPHLTSYLSPGVQNEYIHLMAYHVCKDLTEKIKKVKYCGLIFDSTPDQMHREQVSQVIRYVDVDFDKKTVCVKYVFLGFLQLHQKDAGSFIEVTMQHLEKDEIKTENCRSQYYDNAVVMAGHWNGVQQRIYEKKTNRQCLLTVTIIHFTWWVFMPLDKTQKWFLFLGPLTHCTISFPVLRSVGKS